MIRPEKKVKPYFEAVHGTLYQGDALTILRELPSESVQCCITSPPYLGLRNYGVAGQIGLEETPEAHIEALLSVFREVRRVLRNDGTLWLNYGDTYSFSGDKRNWQPHGKQLSNTASIQAGPHKVSNLPPKNLLGMPWRVAFALQADGWNLRSDIIWHKPNAMPESVKDRPTRAHEYLFLLSKCTSYYYDHEAVREPACSLNLQAFSFARQVNEPDRPGQTQKQHRSGRRMPAPVNRKIFRGGGAYTHGQSFDLTTKVENKVPGVEVNESFMRAKRDVWSIPTCGCPDAHFATFPPALIEPCILAGSRPGDLVLDPFMGSGTTGMVARQKDRKWLGIELNPEYCALALRRIDVARLRLSECG
jgi:DNA modification methylase